MLQRKRLMQYLVNQTPSFVFTKIKIDKGTMSRPQNNQSNLRPCHFSHVRNLQMKTISTFTSSSTPSQIPFLQEVEAKISQVIKTAKPSISTIERNYSYSHLGFDSLDKTELIIRMEDYFEEDLTDEEARNIETVGETIDIFFKKLNAKVTNKIVMRDHESFSPSSSSFSPSSSSFSRK